MKRILIVNDGFPPKSWGGASSVAYLHAEAMRVRGWEVTTFSTDIAYHPRWRAWRSLYNPPALREFKKVLDIVKPDVVHFHNIHERVSYHAILLARRAGAKTFLTAHDVMSFAYQKLHNFIDYEDVAIPSSFNYHVPWWVNLMDARLRYNPFRNLVVRHYFKKLDQIFTVSDALKQAFSDNGISDNVHTVHNGVDIARFTPTPMPETPTALFVGRFTPDKGRDVLLRAFAQVLTKIPTAKLRVVGVDPKLLEPSLKEILNDLDVHEQVTFIKPVSYFEMPKQYEESSVVVVPSVIFDSFPTANLEGMAAGKPVIATCFGGSREVVVDGVTGYIVNPLDVAGMASRITELLATPARAAEIGNAGKVRLVQDFSLEQQITAYERFYINA